MSNSEIIEWLKKKAETVTMPGSRKMYQAAVKALEAQKYMVSRQAVLDALNNIEIPRNASWYQYYQQALTAVDKLPPAPTTEVATDINVATKDGTDAISRQAAIEALGEKPVAWSKGEYERGLQNQWGYDVSAIKQLPSAQPEHIRGHWICDRSWSEGVGMGESYGHYWKCDKCGYLEQGDWGECGCNFCSNCGSDNREVTA